MVGTKEDNMGSSKRILLVEDNPRDAELTIEALDAHDLGDQVAHVEDGVEALDYLHRRSRFADRAGGNPAVVLLDLKMPKVDGLQVLREIKGDSGLRMIPVVVMTSSREDRDLQAAYELGVNAYVVKPMKFADFIDAVKQVGAFWAIFNEPPLGSIARPERIEK